MSQGESIEEVVGRFVAHKLKEPRQLVGKRQRPPATAANEPGKDDLQHLLDRTADLPGNLARTGTPRAETLSDPLGDERLNVLGQVFDAAGAARPGELPERNQQRHPPANASSSVAALNQPADIPLDLRADPGTANTINRARLDEVRLQHEGQPPIG